MYIHLGIHLRTHVNIVIYIYSINAVWITVAKAVECICYVCVCVCKLLWCWLGLYSLFHSCNTVYLMKKKSRHELFNNYLLINVYLFISAVKLASYLSYVCILSKVLQPSRMKFDQWPVIEKQFKNFYNKFRITE